MAFKSQFFDSVENDRPYSAEDMARAFSVFSSSGVLLNEGIYGHESFLIFCNVNSNYKIVAQAGKAILKGYTISSTDFNYTPIVIDNGDGLNKRNDLVVLEMDTANRNISLRVLRGDATNYPTPVKTNILYQLPLAHVEVPSNYVSGGNDTALIIRDKREWAINGMRGFKQRRYTPLTMTAEGGWTQSVDNPLSFSILPNGFLHLHGVIHHGYQTQGLEIALFPPEIDFAKTYWEPVMARSLSSVYPAIAMHAMDIQSKAKTGLPNASLAISFGFEQGQAWSEIDRVSINTFVPVIYSGTDMFE